MRQRIGVGYHCRARYEMILFFREGQAPSSTTLAPGVLSGERVGGGYPTEKPIACPETADWPTPGHLASWCG